MRVTCNLICEYINYSEKYSFKSNLVVTFSRSVSSKSTTVMNLSTKPSMY